jgi:hypothetical protein
VVGGRGFGDRSGVFVKEFDEGLVGVMVEVVDFIAAREEVGDGLWGRFIDDGGGDYVCHVAVIGHDGDVELRVRVEASYGCEMHVAAENTNAD